MKVINSMKVFCSNCSYYHFAEGDETGDEHICKHPNNQRTTQEVQGSSSDNFLIPGSIGKSVIVTRYIKGADELNRNNNCPNFVVGTPTRSGGCSLSVFGLFMILAFIIIVINVVLHSII